MMVNESLLERRDHLASPDPVFIGFRYGVVARMKIRVDFLGRQQANRRWKQPVHSLPEVYHRNRVLQRHPSYLSQRMNTGVGPSRASDVNRPLFDSSKDFFQTGL